ncbi:MAG: thiol reductant ABC exporter subunit CydC [Candidatus Limnocylindrales bacterium]|jgi:thiol reductant ABC exporter CydC subunit
MNATGRGTGRGGPGRGGAGRGDPGGFAALVRVARYGRTITGRLLLAVAAGVAAAGAAIALTATSAWLISRAAERPPVLYLMVAVTGVRFFGVSRGALRYAERLASHDAAFRVLSKLRSGAYARLERLAPAGLTEFRSGDLLARLVDDVDGLADLWLRLLLPYSIAGVAATVSVAAIWLFVPPAGIVLCATLVFVAFVVPVLTVTIARHGERRIAGSRGELAAATLEVLTGAPELLVAGAAEARLESLAAIDGRLADAEARTAAGAGVGALLSGLASGLAIWIGLLAGVAALRAGTVEGVMLAVAALTPIAVHEAIGGLVPAAQHLPGLAAMASRLDDVTSRPDPVSEPQDPEPLPAGPYGLTCRGLRARYLADGPDALTMPDVRVRAGERLLVTGPSGSGKSTFGAVLVRFLEPSHGTVELVGSDGSAEIRRLSGDDVRRAICLCAQDPHIFDNSVAENVRLARAGATDAQVAAALSRAQLSGWVASLPDGLATLVGEHGARLSGGQRQRLSLARAILADAPVVVFDEPTEHLDEATATALVADILEATSGRTVVMITHRPELMASTAWTARVDLVALTGGADDRG